MRFIRRFVDQLTTRSAPPKYSHLYNTESTFHESLFSDHPTLLHLLPTLNLHLLVLTDKGGKAFESNFLTQQQSCAYCEVPGDITVRIREEGVL